MPLSLYHNPDTSRNTAGCQQNKALRLEAEGIT
jgi:hypothetical protein